MAEIGWKTLLTFDNYLEGVLYRPGGTDQLTHRAPLCAPASFSLLINLDPISHEHQHLANTHLNTKPTTRTLISVDYQHFIIYTISSSDSDSLILDSLGCQRLLSHLPITPPSLITSVLCNHYTIVLWLFLSFILFKHAGSNLGHVLHLHPVFKALVL